MLKDRRIALIGGAGFIGHNMALRLKELGADVHVVDSFQHNNLLAFATKIPDMVNGPLYLRIINERLELLRDAGVPLHTIDARDYHGISRILTQIQVGSPGTELEFAL